MAKGDWHKPQRDYFIFNFIVFLWVVVKTTPRFELGSTEEPAWGSPQAETNPAQLKLVGENSELLKSVLFQCLWLQTAPSQPLLHI